MAAMAEVLRDFPAATSRKLDTDIDVIRAVKEHLILSTDKQNAERQMDLWLSENPSIKVIKLHTVKPEPQTLLTLIGSKHVPRVSITVEYEEEPNVPAESHSRTATPSQESY
jgi:hypothetical protein